MNAVFDSHTCAVCGKTVFSNGKYAYKKRTKDGMQYYCGWNCFRKAEGENNREHGKS